MKLYLIKQVLGCCSYWGFNGNHISHFVYTVQAPHSQRILLTKSKLIQATSNCIAQRPKWESGGILQEAL